MCAFTSFVKIVNQLQISAPGADAKSAPSVISEVDFDHALATASAIEKPRESEPRQLNPKQIQSIQPQALAPKKKDTTSPSPVSDSASPLVLPITPLLQNMPNEVAARLPVNDGVALQTSGFTSGNLQGVPGIDAAVGDQKLVEPSAEDLEVVAAHATPPTASAESRIPSVLPKTEGSSPGELAPDVLRSKSASVVPTNKTLAPGDHASSVSVEPKTVTSAPENSPSRASSTATPVTPDSGDFASGTSTAPADPVSPFRDLTSQASVDPAPATPAVSAVSSEPSIAPQVTNGSKPSNPSGSAPAVDASDPTVITVQQGAAAVAQSIAAPVTLPIFSSISDTQPEGVIKPGKTQYISSAAAPVKGTLPHQRTQVASIAKPVSSSSPIRSKSAGPQEGDVQVVLAPAASPSSLKIPETSEVIDHAMTDSQGATTASVLQVLPQALQSDGAIQIAQTPLSVTNATEGTAQNPSALTPSESPAITSAQLTQSMRSSEMKLGMQSTEFGNISISTSLNHQAISAQISIDHAELGRALAIHLPAIEEKLGSAYGVQAKVELREGHNPSSSNESSYSNSGQQSREQRKSGYGGSTMPEGALFAQGKNRTNFTATSVTAGSARLDIRI